MQGFDIMVMDEEGLTVTMNSWQFLHQYNLPISMHDRLRQSTVSDRLTIHTRHEGRLEIARKET